jgi:hypothetical protein
VAEKRVSFDERYRYLLQERAAIRGEYQGVSPQDAIQCMHQALTEYENSVEKRLAALEAGGRG